MNKLSKCSLLPTIFWLANWVNFSLPSTALRLLMPIIEEIRTFLLRMKIVLFLILLNFINSPTQ